MAQEKFKIIFMGTPGFAADILQGLIDSGSCDVLTVYTMPDAIRGRGKKLVASPVKEAALSNDITVETPKDFKETGIVENLKSYNPDFIIVAAYGMLLPQSVLDAPKYECLNVHGSLLPKWRGAAPVQRAILNGDDKIGYSIMRMEAGLDTGDYCFQNSIDASDKSTVQIFDWMAKDCVPSLISAMQYIANGKANWIKQDDDKVSVAEKFEKRELWFKYGDSNRDFYLKIKASSPETPAKCNIAGKNVTILEVNFNGEDIEIISLKPDGKSQMPWKAFLAGIQDWKSKDLSPKEIPI